MRLAAYTGTSVVLATGVFLKALHQRANFYSACVYLSQSNANLMILTNLCLVITGYILFWFQRLLYGPLRAIETEQLYERAWFAVTETCLAMTIFRGSLGGWFLVMFISLLVGKVWGWIGEGRVEYLEQQPPANPTLFHTRLAMSLLLTVLFNVLMLRYCVDTVIHQAKPDMMVMFGFEFAILTILSTSTAARYGISLAEIYINRMQVRAKIEERRAEIRAARAEAIREHARAGATSPPTDLPSENDVSELEIDVPGWEEKGRWIFYLDLLTDFVKLLVYLTFFAILLTFYGLPIHILRDVVVTIRSFARRIMDFLRYRNATRDMNERYPDATGEEITSEDVCIICREEMIPVQPAPADAGAQPAANAPRVPDRLRPKKLPCGHILHFACLRSWLERQQNCPTCRRPVVPSRTNGATGADANAAENGGMGQQNGVRGDPGQPGQGELPRARVYQFGPFRIGFGAVRGDLLQNLQQQMNQGNVPLQPGVNANQQGPRQIGFGFGFGRHPQDLAQAQAQALAQGQAQAEPTPLQTPLTTTISAIHAQLQLLEQQIAQEINALRLATEQLHQVHTLQTELDRLRFQANPVGSATPTTLPPGTSETITHRQFVSTGASSMSSGDPRLPEGLVLPVGWTIIPLGSANAGTEAAPQGIRSSSNFPTPSSIIQPEHSVATSEATPQENQSEPAVNNINPTSLSLDVHNAPLSQDHRDDSPSQEWTDVQSEQVPESGPSAIPSTWGTTHTPEAPVAESIQPESGSESVSKGKGRAVTVEEAVDEDTS
ncbi:hypothetical protein N7495_004618 [Penicillium taxi]|uniref:uncharacterized protein n=1 Tax=Penicillium taxi TaxID=168475 RepID=UPI002544E296|nr:uncharacterized protein N7495_004618 [Penicillium taxi]KAJ5899874.1 hypothetical protein N7495_004618 [Penicillium taxi]